MTRISNCSLVLVYIVYGEGEKQDKHDDTNFFEKLLMLKGD